MRLVKELGELQELLYAAGTDALLIVLQGMDTSGKDGTIRAVLSDMNAFGVHVWSFKVPTEEERAHDFLWRHHLHTPGLSSVAVFNRSYYEAVLVELVQGIVSPEVAVSRYPHINDFELLLDQSRTLVAKFFLHLSKEKQAERLLARQEEVEKWWKLSLGDWEERRRWDDYMAAYQAAINATATILGALVRGPLRPQVVPQPGGRASASGDAAAPSGRLDGRLARARREGVGQAPGCGIRRHGYEWLAEASRAGRIPVASVMTESLTEPQEDLSGSTMR